jgi:hypothetical protein
MRILISNRRETVVQQMERAIPLMGNNNMKNQGEDYKYRQKQQPISNA